MMRKALLAAAMMLSVLASASSHAAVSVRFVNPERYTDAGSYGGGSTEATVAEFSAYLQKLGERFLAPGQNLSIDVLDIDLAGQYEPWRGAMSDVRIMRDITPPRIKLRYVLTEKGRRLRNGEEDISDMNYQMTSGRSGSDRYGYEKALLDDWFRRTFPRNRP